MALSSYKSNVLDYTINAGLELLLGRMNNSIIMIPFVFGLQKRFL